MVELPVYVINLDRSTVRWNHMMTAFPREKLRRVPAIDGSVWEKDGEFQDDGRPLWDESSLAKLKLAGSVADDPVLGIGGCAPLWPCVPGDVACAMSHLVAWSAISDSEHEWAIVLEDDVQPTPALRGKLFSEVLCLPEDADLVFLFGNTPEHDFFTLDDSFHVLSGYGMLGYAISRRGAVCASKAVFPIYEPVDRQVWKRLFKRNTMENRIPLRRDLKKIEAYRVREPLIEIAEVGLNTTMVKGGGIKTWTKKRLL